MNNAIQTVMFFVVFTPIMTYITKKSREEKEANDSKIKFSVCLPGVYAGVFIFAGWFFLIMFIYRR